ncbi:septal ring lytic transglycosylase RlpA family protein [Echinicola jeungdonensis]|uniref:Probable endolytic peptidoglycan transglycosylase RlpA n=1 Tax=Echinicola jeungdonensis TaxID=709343 RepID=A0ABV5J4P3_9BACT|nr:septal ring lytic transglycosylase RlpA family protein [Echinicola jeungdonensis]MDN3668710.1 septal ring lytic transglycosylase RlpA family protein [Echinicola jeungdonensis]
MNKVIFILSCCMLLMINEVWSQEGIVKEETSLVIEEGVASYYGRLFHNRKTANGEIFDMDGMTAAHKHLPFGTKLRVTNLVNGKEVIVRVNDRLPRNSKRTIDLSRGAARKLEMIKMGLAPVKLRVLKTEGIARLLQYYENIPESLRLRLYYQPLDFNKNTDYIFNRFPFEDNIDLIN